MTDRPILFTPENAQKICDGKKVQTRRIITPQPPDDWTLGLYHPLKVTRRGGWYPGEETYGLWGHGWDIPCPYGTVGDRLWCRTAWWHYKSGDLEMAGYVGGTITLLDSGPTVFHANPEFNPAEHKIWRKRPSINLPKWACRTWLELTNISVERLQDMSEEDARADGCLPWELNPFVWVLEFTRIEHDGQN